MLRVQQFRQIGGAILLVLCGISLFPSHGWGDVKDPVWIAPLPDFSDDAHVRSVEALLKRFEEAGTVVRPTSHPRVALKIYTNSGPGLRTPHALVRAVLKVLRSHGYRDEDLFLCDLEAHRLRDAGYLPPVSVGGDRYEGVKVLALNDSGNRDPRWYYDSPLPPNRFLDPFGTGVVDEASGEDRKSFLPTPLLFEADLWINLPVVTDHPHLGINGALVNATLWAVTNQQRFFNNRASAAAASAEIAAIPELRRTYGFTIATMETFQYVGGPAFNANYTGSRTFLAGSRDALAIDRLALSLLNRERLDHGFAPIGPELPQFRYAEALGIGDSSVSRERLRPVFGDPDFFPLSKNPLE